jgi:hypothetical protein
VVIILVYVTALISRGKEYKYSNEEAVSASLIQTSNTTNNIDSDSDGLKDWEEDIRGTDKNNPDTDGDNLNDGAEVSSNHDPLKKGPKDLVSTSTQVSKSEAENLTDTEKFSRSFFSRYLQLKQSGLSSDGQSQQELVNELLYETTVSNTYIPIDFYKQSQLNAVSDSDVSIGYYANTFAIIYKKYENEYLKNPFPETMDSEADIIKFSLASKNASNLYAMMEKEMLNVSTPMSLLELHTDFLNNLYSARQIMVKLSLIEKDPVKSLMAIKDQEDNSIKQESIIRDIAKKIFDKNINFKTTDPGFFWYQKI